VSKECKDSLRDQASILFPIINSYCYVTKAVESVALEPIEEKKLLRLLQQGVEAECKSGINKFSKFFCNPVRLSEIFPPSLLLTCFDYVAQRCLVKGALQRVLWYVYWI